MAQQRQSLVKAVCPLAQLRQSVKILTQVIPELRSAVRQFLCRVPDLGGSVCQLIHVIREFVKILQVLVLQVLKEPRTHHRSCEIQRKVLRPRLDLHILGQFDLLRGLVIHEFEGIHKPRESESYHRFLVAQIHQPAVCDLYIAEHVRRKHRCRQHHKRNVRVVLVIETDLHLAGLPRDLLRADLLSLQVVGNAHINRQRLIGLSLVMDILAVVLPQVPSFAGLCVFLVSLGVFDLPQVGPVLDGVRPLYLLKDNLNRLFSGPSRRVRLDIDALILLARRNKGRVNGRVKDHFCLIPFRSVCRRAFRPGIR